MRGFETKVHISVIILNSNHSLIRQAWPGGLDPQLKFFLYNAGSSTPLGYYVAGYYSIDCHGVLGIVMSCALIVGDFNRIAEL